MEIFVLTCEECNGEYGELVHISAHSTLDKAMERQRSDTLEESYLKDGASREWKHSCVNEWTLSVGTWGYTSWKIVKLPIDAPMPEIGTINNPILDANIIIENDNKPWCKCSTCGELFRSLNVYHNSDNKLMCYNCLDMSERSVE